MDTAPAFFFQLFGRLTANVRIGPAGNYYPFDFGLRYFYIEQSVLSTLQAKR